MKAPMNDRAHSGLALGFALLLGLLSPPAAGPQSTGAAATSGQSATLLPDGRWLIAGGEGPGGPQATMAIQDRQTGVTTPLNASLQHPRAWHSATVLPDGSVLILGGVGTDGVRGDAELFDPETERVEPLRYSALTPRAQHTATLLTDGRVLIVGGLSDTGETLADAELWDPREQSARLLTGALATARRAHRATLLPSGAVLLWGGADNDDRELHDGEVYDPDTRQFSSLVSVPEMPVTGPAQLAGSIPEEGATDVPVDMLIAVRFSRPLRVETVNMATATLTGPNGDEPVGVVPAEAGMLAFITPELALVPGGTYTLSFHGLMDSRDVPVLAMTLTFRTAGRAPAAGPASSPPQSGTASRLEPTSQRDDPAGQESEEWTPVPGTWKTGRPPSRWQSLPPLQAPPGVTALAGQVLTLAGEPLAATTLKIQSTAVSTDDTGRFLLLLDGHGHHELLIDGRTASDRRRTYGVFEVGVDIKAGQTNVLPYTIWMPRLDTEHAVAIASPTVREVVVTTPKIPGLELQIPPGTVLRDEDGEIVRSITITPIPLDRPPFPLARNVEVPVYFTVQPGGAYVYGSAGVRLVYPNRAGLPPGARLNFWRHDASEVGWSVYGLGTVTRDGGQVVPNPGVALYELTPAMLTPGMVPPEEGVLPAGIDATPGSGPAADGDPVDLATGLFVLTKTDLLLPDVAPIALTRTYRQNDPNPRPFGIGTSHPYEIFLWSTNAFQEADLVFPHGGRVHYVRTSPGIGFADAVFEHTTTSSRFYKSRIVWNGDGWTLTLKDGSALIFGENAPVQAMRDRHGNTVTILRSNGQSGNVRAVLSPNGRWLSFTYDAGNRITQATDNLGRTASYTYDSSGRLVGVSDPAGGLTDYTYDDTNPGDPIRKTRMTTLRDPRRIVFLTNTYDANGRVVRQTQADATAYQFAYTLDVNGRVTRTDITDPRGSIRRVTFNADGYPLSDTRALGKSEQQLTTYTRQVGTNLVLTRTDPLGRQTAFGHDALGNVTSITRAAGTPQAVTTTFTYDPTFNQLATVTDPLSHTTRFTYGAVGNLATVTNALGQPTTFTYNSAGQPVSVTNALGQRIQLTYELGDLVTVTDPLGNRTTRFLDAAGRLSILTDPLGRQTRYEYDLLNRLTRLTNARGGATRFVHDPNANLSSVTDARDNATTFTYNNMDRVTARRDPLLRVESYAYDAAGNVTRLTSRKNQETTATYDALNRRTKLTYADGTTTTYTWDKGNRLTQVTDSIAGTITRTYDSLDRLTRETTPQGTISLTYDAAGRRTSMTTTGQPAVTYTYDAANRLTQVSRGTTTVSMSYDAAGRRTSLTLPNGVVTAYVYDDAARVTTITYSRGGTLLGDLTYSYDAASNRTQIGGSFGRTAIPQPATGTYDAANQQVTFGGKTLTYDLNGNLTNDGSRSYSWNARNRLSGIATTEPTVSFRYDGLGRRTSKNIGKMGTSFAYDGTTPVQTSGPTSNLLTGLGVDEYFTRTDSAGLRAYLTDALGSTIALTDSAGAVQTQYTYEPFGATTSTGGISTNPIQYTGRENDGTGLYYFRARYYHPGLQRFISQDLAATAGSNPYAYVGNSPLNGIDPFGLFTIIMYGGAASSGPGGWSASSGGNQGLKDLETRLESGGERVASLSSGQIQDAIRLATQAQAGGEPVYLVGHSLGGSGLINVATQLQQPPTHLYTIDPFLPNQNIPANIPTTNFLQREDFIFGSYLQGQNVQNVLIEGLGFLGHFDITANSQVQSAITQQVISGRK